MEVFVHPTFDPTDNTWFTDDGVTAKSLAALQRKLPPGVVIQDYYPGGYGNIVQPRLSAAVAKVTLKQVLGVSPPTVRERWLPPAKAEERTTTESRPPGVLEVLTLGDVKFQPKPSQPAKPPQQAIVRKRMPSGLPRIDWTILSNQETLKGLVEEGLTAKVIGARMDTTGNSIIGACARLGFQLRHRNGQGRARDKLLLRLEQSRLGQK
jgi:hypothetical protein